MSSMVSSIIAGLRRAGLVLVIGVLVGILLYVGTGGSLLFWKEPAATVGYSVLVGILYMALLDGVVRLTRLVVAAFVPLRSIRAVVYHTVLPAVGVTLAFVGLTAALYGTVGAVLPLSTAALLVLGTGAALVAAGGSGLLALRTYHEHERQDHAEGWEARMRRLRTQTVPPVLLNTLETATSLLDDNPEDAKSLLAHLESLLRYRQQAHTDETVPLADEIQAALWYVELARVRHGDALDVGFDVPDALLSVPVPRLCLLPLLENAIEHGTADGECTVTITGRHDDAEFCLAVLDTGPGFDTTDPDVILRRGSGISDLYGRLREHFGPRVDLSLLPQGVLWCAPRPETSSAGSVSDAPTATVRAPE